MPRELTHWLVLEESRHLAAKHELYSVYDAILQNHSTAYTGAVAYDAPYYFDFGRRQDFTDIADQLHGANGEDTSILVRNLSTEICKIVNPDQQRQLWALALGMVTHQHVDAMFHPLISYLTGDWYNSDHQHRRWARCRYKLFEVELDSWFLSVISPDAKKNLFEYQVGPSSDLEIVSRLLGGILPLPSDSSSVSHEFWLKSFRDMQKAHQIFRSNLIGALYRGGSYLLPGVFAEHDAMFSIGRRAPNPIFNSPFKYQHPITGEHFEHSVQDLFQLSVEKCIETFQCFEPLIRGETEQLILPAEHGVSMDYGMYGVKSSDARYFLKL